MTAETIPAEVVGPRSKGITCNGCPALREKWWEEYLDNDERDSGTYYKCGAAEDRLIAGPYGHPSVTTPDWCPALPDRSTRPAEPAPEVERRWIGQRAGQPAKATRMERVAEIWRDQGLSVTEWVPRSILEAERARADAAEQEASSLAANQCHAGYAGEHGQHRCREVDELRRERDEAREERDALLTALGWETGSFRTDLTRKVILDDTAELRPAMVKARKAQQRAQGDAMLWQCSVADGMRQPLLVRVWEQRRTAVKRAETAETALSRALQDRDEAQRILAASGRCVDDLTARLDAAENAQQKARDEGFEHALKILEDALGSPTYYAADGSETWEGDTRGTIYNLLRAAGVWRGDDDTLVTAATQDEAGRVGDGKVTLKALLAAEAVIRSAFIAGRESIYGVSPAFHEAAWEAYRARLRADQPATGEGNADEARA